MAGLAALTANQPITSALHLSESAVSNYPTTMFDKLGVAHDDGVNRRVLPVPTDLNDPHDVLGARRGP